MEFLFILHYLSFLSVFIKGCEKITKQGVYRHVVHTTLRHKTATCTQFLMFFEYNTAVYHVNTLVNKRLY